MYDYHLEPPVDYWEEYKKPLLIGDLIENICKNIGKHQEIYDLIYEHISENTEKYLPETSYDGF